MRKTLFSKHFITVTSIILLSITILGAVLLVFASQYFKQDRYKLLEHNAQQAAALTYSNIRNNYFENVTPQVVLPMYTILANSIEADIYLANTEGELLLFAEGTGADHINKTIPKEIIEKASSGGCYREIGKMGNLYPDAHYTVGIPVNRDDGLPAAVVFVSTSASTLTIFLVEILKMFAVSSLAVLILAFAAVYFITADLVSRCSRLQPCVHVLHRRILRLLLPFLAPKELGSNCLLALVYQALVAMKFKVLK